MQKLAQMNRDQQECCFSGHAALDVVGTAVSDLLSFSFPRDKKPVMDGEVYSLFIGRSGDGAEVR